MVPAKFHSELWPSVSRDERGVQSTYTVERLAELVLHAWADQVESPTTRPDVLAIVCEFLANPEEPHTYDVARFAVILALRAQYRIPYTTEILAHLRKSYDVLRARHAKRNLRVLKRASRLDYFLIDILCLVGPMRRRFSEAAAQSHYNAFREAPFGVHGARPVVASGDEATATLVGEMPDFGSVVNVAFSQPTVVPGLDVVTGGLLGPVVGRDSVSRMVARHSTAVLTNESIEGAGRSAGGVVTLIGGPPGSGKTSLAILLARRLAELGSVVSYVSIEEDAGMLRAKAATMAEPLSAAFDELVPSDTVIDAPALLWPERQQFVTLDEVLMKLQNEFSNSVRWDSDGIFSVPFPRVVVIDSITALLEVTQHATSDMRYRKTSPANRRDFARIVKGLRQIGLCVIMIGSADDADDTGLAYVVDNVFSLSLDASASPRHPVRLLAVNKTRLQRSSRGSHVFHLGGQSGCSVSPSLHAVLQELKQRPEIAPDRSRIAILWLPGERDRQQAVLDGILEDGSRPIIHRDRSQILVYGTGSSGKARIAVAMALEPAIYIGGVEEGKTNVLARLRNGEQSIRSEQESFGNSRVLILSFLYDAQYYERIVERFVRNRFRRGDVHRDLEASRRTIAVDETRALDVIALRPGFVDPETLVGRVRRDLRRGELEGRPYTAVVIDGVHNLLMQFPLLAAEPLLWPTLFRLFRTRGITTVTTFTFFALPGPEAGETIEREGSHRALTSERLANAAAFGSAAPAQQLFFHLLVGSCDYTYAVGRALKWSSKGSRRELIRVVQQTSPDSFERTSVIWDPVSSEFTRDAQA